MDQAVILFGHGSRDPAWRQPIEAVAVHLARRQPGIQVACAWLELEQPDLPKAAARLVAAGARRVAVVPMFLGTGRHAREDLPRLMEGLQAAHPDVSFVLRPAVGEEPQVIEVLSEVAGRALL